MLTCIITILVGIIFTVCLYIHDRKKYGKIYGFDFTFIGLSIFIGILLPGFIPHETNCTTSLVGEIELVSLSNDLGVNGHGSYLYVSISSDNVYTYRYEVNSEFNTESSKSYKVATLQGNNITEIEDVNCTKPVLKIYDVTHYVDATLWTWGYKCVDPQQRQYVFYVPEGTISKDVQLN